MTIIGRKTGTHAPRNDKKRAGGLYKWQRDLWFATATLNFCKYYYFRGLRAGEQYEHQLIGSHVNVVSTEVMANYLEQAIERLARRWVAENRPGRSIFIKEAIAFREGVAARISERLWNLRYEHTRQEEAKRKEERERNRARGIETENALVLQDVINTEEDLNNDYINKWEPGTSARMRSERAARQAAAEAEAAELLRKQEEWDAAHPEDAKRRKKREAERAEQEYEKWKRKSQSKRYRKATPEEERRQLGSFHTGYAEGDKVSLNKQVSKTDQRKLG
jgi:hypothetical protein